VYAAVIREFGGPAVLRWGRRRAVPAAGWTILGEAERGTYAELVRVPPGCLRPLNWNWKRSATFALTGLTAFRALVTRRRTPTWSQGGCSASLRST
jgi:NADPH:quinone reductase-like Zn-dependent oxidoreductase